MEKYSSGLISESFWFIEFKKIIKLKHEGKSWDDIKDLCLQQNLLCISKQYRAVRVFGYLKKRVNELDDEMLNIFVKTDLSTQKIINLISIAKENRLFFEFLYEIYREKVLLGAIELAESDVNIFFKNKQQQDESIASWTDSTINKLRRAYINFMTDAGLLTEVNKQKKITPPIMDASLENHLENNGGIHIVKAITGVI